MKKISIISALTLLLSIYTGCVIEEEAKPKQYYVTFTVDGVQKKYSSTEYDGFWTDNSEESTRYINSWFEDGDGGGDSVYMTLPADVATSSTYDGTYVASGFSFGIDYNGTWYFVKDSSFELIVTEWGSVGNTVKGTFTGTVIDETENDNVRELTNGTFETINNTDEVD